MDPSLDPPVVFDAKQSNKLHSSVWMWCQFHQMQYGFASVTSTSTSRRPMTRLTTSNFNYVQENTIHHHIWHMLVINSFSFRYSEYSAHSVAHSTVYSYFYGFNMILSKCTRARAMTAKCPIYIPTQSTPATNRLSIYEYLLSIYAFLFFFCSLRSCFKSALRSAGEVMMTFSHILIALTALDTSVFNVGNGIHTHIRYFFT